MKRGGSWRLARHGRRAVTDGLDLPDLLRQMVAGPLTPGFERREVQLLPGESLGYVDADWHDALIVVREGRVEVTCRAGGHRSFDTGDTIWFDGLEVAAFANDGSVALILVAIRRA
jgi:quercetin dioxygenase-like cupin family protein